MTQIYFDRSSPLQTQTFHLLTDEKFKAECFAISPEKWRSRFPERLANRGKVHFSIAEAELYISAILKADLYFQKTEMHL